MTNFQVQTRPRVDDLGIVETDSKHSGNAGRFSGNDGRQMDSRPVISGDGMSVALNNLSSARYSMRGSSNQPLASRSSYLILSHQILTSSNSSKGPKVKRVRSLREHSSPDAEFKPVSSPISRLIPCRMTFPSVHYDDGVIRVNHRGFRSVASSSLLEVLEVLLEDTRDHHDPHLKSPGLCLLLYYPDNGLIQGLIAVHIIRFPKMQSDCYK